MSKDSKIYCPKCGKSFGAGSFLYHPCMVNARTTMLTRKLADKMKRKKLPVDLSGHNAEVPQPTTEDRMQAIHSEIYWLKEARKDHIAMVKAAVKSALKSKRLKGKHAAFWAKKYNELGVQN